MNKGDGWVQIKVTKTGVHGLPQPMSNVQRVRVRLEDGSTRRATFVFGDPDDWGFQTRINGRDIADVVAWQPIL